MDFCCSGVAFILNRRIHISILTWTLYVFRVSVLLEWGLNSESENCTHGSCLNTQHCSGDIVERLIRYQDPTSQKLQCLYVFKLWQLHARLLESYRFWFGPFVAHTKTEVLPQVFIFHVLVRGADATHLGSYCLWDWGQDINKYRERTRDVVLLLFVSQMVLCWNYVPVWACGFQKGWNTESGQCMNRLALCSPLCSNVVFE